MLVVEMDPIIEIANVWLDHHVEAGERDYKLVEVAAHGSKTLRFYPPSQESEALADLASIREERERREALAGARL